MKRLIAGAALLITMHAASAQNIFEISPDSSNPNYANCKFQTYDDSALLITTYMGSLVAAKYEKTCSAEFLTKAKDGKLTLDELTGGTFSISNGGVFGSMLSTPIINPPQSAILGVHATKERAVVENGQIVIRPMNYLAMSYDHRIIDGREAVLGLVAMKEALEDPARLLFNI